MSEKNNSDELENKIKEKLQTSVDGISPHIASRLQAARRTALQEGLKASNHSRFYWKPVSLAFSSTAVLLMGVLVVSNMQFEQELNIMDDLNLLSTNQDIDFYEDIEFYSWLEESEQNG